MVCWRTTHHNPIPPLPLPLPLPLILYVRSYPLPPHILSLPISSPSPYPLPPHILSLPISSPSPYPLPLLYSPLQILQNLANHLPFRKEGHMMDFNDYLEANFDKTRK